MSAIEGKQEEHRPSHSVSSEISNLVVELVLLEPRATEDMRETGGSDPR